MKIVFFTLLMSLFAVCPVMAQQDSLLLRITDEQGQVVAGAVVLLYPESYLLGASDINGEVEIKGIHIPDHKQIVFQCLGYEMVSLSFKEVKRHPEIRLKEKITELPEAVVKAVPLPKITSLVHQQLRKKYKAKDRYVRYYAPASYYKSVESQGRCVNLHHEHGLFITSGDTYRKDKWDNEYMDYFIPATTALSCDLTSDGRDTLKRLYLFGSQNHDREYDATRWKIFNLMRSVYLYGPLFAPPEEFTFKLIDIDSNSYTIIFATRPEAYPQKNRALAKGTLQIDRQSLQLKQIDLDYFDYQLHKLIHNYYIHSPFVTKASLTFEYDPEGHLYISTCSCESSWKYTPSADSRVGSIEKPSRPLAAKNRLIEKEQWICEKQVPIPEAYRNKVTFNQSLWARLALTPYQAAYFSAHPNLLATPQYIQDLEQYMPLEQQYRHNSHKFYITTQQPPESDEDKAKAKVAKRILFNLFFNH